MSHVAEDCVAELQHLAQTDQLVSLLHLLTLRVFRGLCGAALPCVVIYALDVSQLVKPDPCCSETTLCAVLFVLELKREPV